MHVDVETNTLHLWKSKPHKSCGRPLAPQNHLGKSNKLWSGRNLEAAAQNFRSRIDMA